MRVARGPDATEETSRDGVSEGGASEAPLRWQRPLALFLATVASVFYTGGLYSADFRGVTEISFWGAMRLGGLFAVPLLAILLAHEFGHYFAARIHGVKASLPHFIPLPVLSPFGTMGAIIGMPDRIASRRALLDIGASGPLAGMIVALPVLGWGLAHSVHQPLAAHGTMEGQSLLYHLMKAIFVGPLAPNEDIYLHPTAFAGWTGLFITMLNLIPVGQTDGGHIAYALFGKRQNRFAPWVRGALLPLFVFNVVTAVWAQRAAGYPQGWQLLVTANSTSWLVWWVLLGVLHRVSGGNHPPVDESEPLGPVRRAVAVGSLILFVLLFMRTPFTQS